MQSERMTEHFLAIGELEVTDDINENKNNRRIVGDLTDDGIA